MSEINGTPPERPLPTPDEYEVLLSQAAAINKLRRILQFNNLIPPNITGDQVNEIVLGVTRMIHELVDMRRSHRTIHAALAKLKLPMWDNVPKPESWPLPVQVGLLIQDRENAPEVERLRAALAASEKARLDAHEAWLVLNGEATRLLRQECEALHQCADYANREMYHDRSCPRRHDNGGSCECHQLHWCELFAEANRLKALREAKIGGDSIEQ